MANFFLGIEMIIMNNAFYFIISLFTNTLITTIDTNSTHSQWRKKKNIVTQKCSFQFAVNFHMNFISLSFAIMMIIKLIERYWIVFELRHFHMWSNIVMIVNYLQRTTKINDCKIFGGSNSMKFGVHFDKYQLKC